MSVVLEGIDKRYGGVSALSGIDATVERNTLVALLGPSGCGKSTLLRLVAGFEVPDRGRIHIDGIDMTDVSAQHRGIGFVAQNYALFPHMTVAQNVGFALDVRGARRIDVRRRVAELLELVRLEGYGARLPRELSGGQKQRVALARALAEQPRILLLDEPFAALDAHVRSELRAWLRDLHEHTHTTTLLVTHDAQEAMELADRIVLLEGGSIAQIGVPQDLYRAPRSPFAMRFFGIANELQTPGEATRYVRPHELALENRPFRDASPACVKRVVALGSRVRVDLITPDGQHVSAELSETRARELAPVAGQALFFAARRSHSFATAG